RHARRGGQGSGPLLPRPVPEGRAEERMTAASVMESSEMRRTKIVCTIGPASSSAEALDRLVAAGMDVARLNFSHGPPAHHAGVGRRLREGEDRWGRPVAILQDLQGPKIRLGTFGENGG